MGEKYLQSLKAGLAITSTVLVAGAGTGLGPRVGWGAIGAVGWGPVELDGGGGRKRGRWRRSLSRVVTGEMVGEVAGWGE